jgi:hypothetical protein
MQVRLDSGWTDPAGRFHAAGDVVDVDAVMLARLEGIGVVREESTGDDTTAWSPRAAGGGAVATSSRLPLPLAGAPYPASNGTARPKEAVMDNEEDLQWVGPGEDQQEWVGPGEAGEADAPDWVGPGEDEDLDDDE